MGRRTTTTRTPKRDRRKPVRIGVRFATDAAAMIAVDDVAEPGEVVRAGVVGHIAALILGLGRAALVRVQEVDGAVFADVLTPPSRDPADLVDRIRDQVAAGGPTANPELLEVTGDGLLPGEDVQVAPVLQTVTAHEDGTARALVDSSELGATGQGMLFGAVSGTTILARRP